MPAIWWTALIQEDLRIYMVGVGLSEKPVNLPIFGVWGGGYVC